MAPRQPPGPAPSQTIAGRIARLARLGLKKALTTVMRSQAVTMPKNFPDLPVRLRPWFLLFTTIILVILALLGFTNVANGLVNDKVLHCVCLAIATGFFYFIFDVEEDARRIWIWRWSAVIMTVVTCFFFGGIVSEIVQSFLPSKTFDFGDIAANLLGSSMGLYVAYHLEKHYRARREISRLYQPLYAEDEIDDDEEQGNELGPEIGLPLFSNSSSQTHKHSNNPMLKTSSIGTDGTRLGNVWDTSVNMFDIGEEDSEEDARDARRR